MNPYMDKSLPYSECLKPPCGISAMNGMWVLTRARAQTSPVLGR